MAQYIELPVFDSSLRKKSSERLEVELLGPNRYRLVHSPGLVDGIAAGDEIELSDEERLGYRVVKRSGNLCVWMVYPSPQAMMHPSSMDLKASVERMGGILDGGTKRSLIFTIPVAVGWEPIRAVFDAAVQRAEGSAWLYGNVYDPADGETPLNWW